MTRGRDRHRDRTRGQRDGSRRRRRGQRDAKAVHRRRRLVLGLVVGLIILSLAAFAALGGDAGRAQGSGKEVRLVEIKGIIDPQVGNYVVRNIDLARDEGATAVLLTIDTPGGLDEPMRDIVRSITNSPLPVIVYVYPSGARAASAGTFICMASDVTAMAPGTTIGAAHPSVYGVDLSSEEGEKVLNDAAAYIRSLAQTNGRNADWAELAVRQSIAFTDEEAVEQGVAEFRADTVESLLLEVDGFTTIAKEIVIDTDGATVVESSPTALERFLHLVLNPNIVYILLLLGLLALAYELANPGIGLGAITGFAALALAVYALYILPVNYAGVVIIVLGIALLSADLFFPSHGLLSGGGVISLIIGSFLLFDSSATFLEVSPVLNIVLAVLTGVFFILVVRAGVQARGLPDQSGRNTMFGMVGFSRSDLDPMGQVFVNGELWSAESYDGSTIRAGEEIEVVDISGLMLKVRKTV